MMLRCIIFALSLMPLELYAWSNLANVMCGRTISQRSAKIVGGENAVQFEFPWLVSITRRGNHFCGGTLITNRHVMTAAHCLCTFSGNSNDFIKPTYLKVTLSQHDLSSIDSAAYETGLKSIIIHPDYSCNKARNDIAILELSEEIHWSISVSPACLPADSKSSEYSKYLDNLATVAGWGWKNEERGHGGKATVLQKAKVQIIDNEKCKTWYKSQGKKTKVQETQLCAGHEEGGSDACWADSGGPLMVQTEEEAQLAVIGVVSTGIGCARPYLPGIYTRVSEYISWIREVVEK